MKTLSTPKMTFEGRLIIKWYKNDDGDVRPITIDVNNRDELQEEIYRIKKDFMTLGCDIRNDCKLPYSVKIELSQRV